MIAAAGEHLRRVGHELLALDAALDAAVAATPTPALDVALRRLTRAADHSVLWFSVAAVLSLSGPRGRRAALRGLLSVGAASTAANLVGKPLLPRRRPPVGFDDGGRRFPARVVPRPVSSSFPSGHAASAFAFAGAAGRELPALRLPLHLLAGAVAYSRVHCGVHYPLDVLGGGLVGAAAGVAVAHGTRGGTCADPR
ncbi:MAG: phosphatase PAP2 family protein [Motilibacteraceae bacterium]